MNTPTPTPTQPAAQAAHTPGPTIENCPLGTEVEFRINDSTRRGVLVKRTKESHRAHVESNGQAFSLPIGEVQVRNTRPLKFGTVPAGWRMSGEWADCIELSAAANGGTQRVIAIEGKTRTERNECIARRLEDYGEHAHAATWRASGHIARLTEQNAALVKALEDMLDGYAANVPLVAPLHGTHAKAYNAALRARAALAQTRATLTSASPVLPDEQRLIRAYTAGYHHGHHLTVEGGYVDVMQRDEDTYFEDNVRDLFSDGGEK